MGVLSQPFFLSLVKFLEFQLSQKIDNTSPVEQEQAQNFVNLEISKASARERFIVYNVSDVDGHAQLLMPFMLWGIIFLKKTLAEILQF